jgi:hypothetical protein
MIIPRALAPARLLLGIVDLRLSKHHLLRALPLANYWQKSAPRPLRSTTANGDNVPMREAAPRKDEILQVLVLRFERPEFALQGFNTEPLPGFSGAKAYDLVAAGRGQEVLDFIAAVDAGIHA